MGECMQVNRLFEIIYILLGTEIVTGKALAERFEVSTRTIYRDLDILSGAGIPIYTSKGSKGGIKLLGEFTLDKSVLSKQEQNEILMGLQILQGARCPETKSVMGKLESLFNKEQYDWIQVDFSRWGSEKEEQDKFTSIRRAIMEERLVIFEYVSSYGERTLRKVAPIRLVFKGQSWYLQAYCKLKEDYRTFKIMRIRKLMLTDESFDRNEFQMVDIEAEAKAYPSLIKIKLRFDPQIAFRVYDQFNEEMIIHNEDGSIDVTASYPAGEWIYSYILSFGTLVTVLEPEDVRQKVKQILSETLKKYN